MKNKVIVKRMLIMLLVILVILGSINLFWYVFKYMPYKNMAKNMQLNDDAETRRYSYETEDYTFGMKIPEYLSFASGFLYVTPQLPENAAAFYVNEMGTMVEKNIPHCDLFIWPQMFSETEFCVTVYEETSSVSCMVDRSGAYLPDEYISEAERKEMADLCDERRNEILSLIEAAISLWGSNI